MRTVVSLFCSILIFYNTSYAAKNLNINKGCFKTRQTRYLHINQESLQKFAKSFILHMYAYRNTYVGLGNKEEFLEQLQVLDSTASDELITSIYSSHGLNYEDVIDKLNAIHNDLKELQTANPELINAEIPEGTMITAIINQIDDGFNSQEDSWVKILEEVSAEVNAEGVLTGSEIWGCIKGAVGLSGGLGLSVGAGYFYSASYIIKTVSSVLVRSFGWWGAALFVIDFTVCINDKARD